MPNEQNWGFEGKNMQSFELALRDGAANINLQIYENDQHMEQFLLDQSQLLIRQKKFTLVQVRGNTWCCSEDLIMTLKGRVSPKYSSSLSLLTYFPFSFIYSWSIAESFYYVNHGSSIIVSKNLSNENKNTLCFQRNYITKIVHFGILICILSWRQQKHQCLFSFYWDSLTNFST